MFIIYNTSKLQISLLIICTFKLIVIHLSEIKQTVMTTLDKSNNKLDVIYRGANSGIEKMSASCFYSYDEEIATDYAMMNEKPCLYVFCVDGLNLLEVSENWIIDDGSESFERKDIEKYDGVRTENYAQVLLFGEFDCNTGKFTKSDYENVISMAQSIERKYDR